MRISSSFLASAIALTLFSAGCAGPEKKLGRGLNNVTEFARGGEIRRSMEQAMLWDNPDTAFTTGFIRGMHRSLARTFIGAYEVITFPFPSYEPLLTSTNRIFPDVTVRNKNYPWGGMVLTENPIYPDNFRPGVLADSLFSNDTSLGFSGGDVAPFIPGSRFRIFDQ